MSSIKNTKSILSLYWWHFRCGELESAVKNKSEEVNSLTATKNVLETKLKTAYQDLELIKSA